MRNRKQELADSEFYSLKIGALWHQFKAESFAFWMICLYLFFEYFRPQSIYPSIEILPWTQLAIIGSVLGIAFDKKARWVSSPVNQILVLYFFAIIISSFNAYYPEISFRNLSNFYTWLIIYFLIISIVNTERRFILFIGIFLIASFKLSLSLSISWAQRGFSFTSWGLTGPPGFFQNSGELAIQMLVFWPISWVLIKNIKPYLKSIWLYRLLILMPITAMMVILGSSSRGGQLALIVQLVAMNYRSIFRIKVLAFCGVAFTLIWTFLPDEQKARFEEMGEDKSSIQRLLYWENGIEMINDHPLLGVGYFNFTTYFEEYYREDMLYSFAQLPHNIFIQVGTDVGYTGLLLYLLILLLAVRNNKLTRNQVDPARMGVFFGFEKYLNISLIGFLVAGQFVSVVYYPFLWIHLAFVVCYRNIWSNLGSRKV